MNVIDAGYHGQEFQSKCGRITKLNLGKDSSKSQQYVSEQGQKEEEKRMLFLYLQDCFLIVRMYLPDTYFSVELNKVTFSVQMA